MYYIDNATRAAVKALNAENPKALKGLSDNFDFDFDKKFIAIKKDGAYTINAIKKDVAAIAPEANNVVVLIRRANCWTKKLHVIQLLQGSTNYRINGARGFWALYDYGLDSFYAKKDAEDARKSHTAHYYIVAQSYDHKRGRRGYKPDPLDRHQIRRTNACRDGKGNTYYSSLTLRDVSGQIWQYNTPGYYCGYNTVNPRAVQAYHNRPITDYIDKSGYILPAYREELTRRLKKYKTAKAERAAAMTDFDSAENIAINALRDKREIISKLLTTPKTSDELSEIEKMLNKLRWVVWDWERYNAGKNEASATARKRQIDNIFTDLDKIKFELYAGGVKNENIA